MELIFDPADSSAGKQLLQFAAKLFRKQKADVVLTWSVPGCFNYKLTANAVITSCRKNLGPRNYLLAQGFLNRLWLQWLKIAATGT